MGISAQFETMDCFLQQKYMADLMIDLVRVGQGGPEGENVLVLEDFQRSPLPALVDRHGVCADAQPEVLGKAAFLALRGKS